MKAKKFFIAITGALTFSIAAGALPVNDYAAPASVFAQYQYQAPMSSETITADGYGFVPAGVPAGQAKLLARRAAIVDAQRNLVATIKSTAVDSETTMENFIIKSDIVRTKVNGAITGATVISENFEPDGSYRVTMAVPMHGVGSIGDIAINSVVGDKAPVPVPDPNPSFMETYKPSTSIGGGYTGLVINARGSGLVRTFCPAIYDTNGRAVYGVYNVDKKYAIDYGVVGYAKGDEGWSKVNAGSSRAGANPLVINIVSVRERTVNKCDVVISVEDADRLLAENQRSHFLDNYAVMFEI